MLRLVQAPPDIIMDLGTQDGPRRHTKKPAVGVTDMLANAFESCIVQRQYHDSCCSPSGTGPVPAAARLQSRHRSPHR